MCSFCSIAYDAVHAVHAVHSVDGGCLFVGDCVVRVYDKEEEVEKEKGM